MTHKSSAESKPGAARGKGSRLGLIPVAQFAERCLAVHDASGRWGISSDALLKTVDPCSKVLPSWKGSVGALLACTHIPVLREGTAWSLAFGTAGFGQHPMRVQLSLK